MSSLPDRPRLQPAGPVPVREGAATVGGRRHTPFDVPARAATVVSGAAVALTIAVELLVPGGWGEAAWIPLVAGLVVGLPHGAVDHLVPGWQLGWRVSRLVAFALGYAGVAAVVHLLFVTAPGPALVLFVLLSAWHFGTGETAFADLRAGRPVRRRAAAAAVLGAVVLGLPLVRDTGQTAPLIAALVPGSDGVLPHWLVALVLSTVLPAAVLLAAGLSLAGHRTEAVELAALVTLVLVVPPLAAFGVYFGWWHSLRHLSRVLAEDPANAADLRAGHLGRPLCRFGRAAALPTVVVVVVLGALWSTADGWRGFVAADVPLLAALTVPHVLVVGWLDRRAALAG